MRRGEGAHPLAAGVGGEHLGGRHLVRRPPRRCARRTRRSTAAPSCDGARLSTDHRVDQRRRQQGPQLLRSACGGRSLRAPGAAPHRRRRPRPAAAAFANGVHRAGGSGRKRARRAPVQGRQTWDGGQGGGWSAQRRWFVVDDGRDDTTRMRRTVLGGNAGCGHGCSPAVDDERDGSAGEATDSFMIARLQDARRTRDAEQQDSAANV